MADSIELEEINHTFRTFKYLIIHLSHVSNGEITLTTKASQVNKYMKSSV